MLLKARKFPEIRDLGYALQKGLAPAVRGMIWHIMRGRRPRLFFLGKNVRFVSASRLDLGSGVSIGANSYIETNSKLRCSIGNGVTLRENTWIQCRSGLNLPGEKLLIEDGVYIGPNAVIGVGGPILIEAGCQIGSGFTLSAEEHAAVGGDYTAGSVKRIGIRIGARSWIGNNVTILDGVEIGARAVVGAGAVVTKSIPEGRTALGVPARVVEKDGSVKA